MGYLPTPLMSMTLPEVSKLPARSQERNGRRPGRRREMAVGKLPLGHHLLFLVFYYFILFKIIINATLCINESISSHIITSTTINDINK